MSHDPGGWAALDGYVMQSVFGRLAPADLVRAGAACRAWREASLRPSLWTDAFRPCRSAWPTLGPRDAYLRAHAVARVRASVRRRPAVAEVMRCAHACQPHLTMHGEQLVVMDKRFRLRHRTPSGRFGFAGLRSADTYRCTLGWRCGAGGGRLVALSESGRIAVVDAPDRSGIDDVPDRSGIDDTPPVRRLPVSDALAPGRAMVQGFLCARDDAVFGVAGGNHWHDGDHRLYGWDWETGGRVHDVRLTAESLFPRSDQRGLFALDDELMAAVTPTGVLLLDVRCPVAVVTTLDLKWTMVGPEYRLGGHMEHACAADAGRGIATYRSNRAVELYDVRASRPVLTVRDCLGLVGAMRLFGRDVLCVTRGGYLDADARTRRSPRVVVSWLAVDGDVARCRGEVELRDRPRGTPLVDARRLVYIVGSTVWELDDHPPPQ